MNENSNTPLPDDQLAGNPLPDNPGSTTGSTSRQLRRTNNQGFTPLLVLMAVLLLVVLGVVAIGVYQHKTDLQISSNSSPTSGTTDSGVMGRATIGPTAPVCQQGQSCSEAYSHSYAIVVKSATTQSVVDTVQSDASGHFKIGRPPGNYILTVSEDKSPLGAEPVSVTVSTHQYTNATITFDSGIR